MPSLVHWDILYFDHSLGNLVQLNMYAICLACSPSTLQSISSFDYQYRLYYCIHRPVTIVAGS